MLYLASGTGRLTRLHGSFVPDEDVRRVVEFVKKQATPSYSEELQSLSQEGASEEQAKDEVYEQAKDLVLTSGQASASLIQRRLRVGYPGGTACRTDGGGRARQRAGPRWAA